MALARRQYGTIERELWATIPRIAHFINQLGTLTSVGILLSAPVRVRPVVTG
jgi:hypothetical protein